MLDVSIVDPEDVLSQSTRAQLFALLSELKRPVGTAELAERLELHPNGVRMHLERLQDAGLVERAQSRQARGRPPDVWTVAVDAQPGGEPPRAYQDLGRWLARALRAQADVLRGIEDTGRQIGHELAPADACADVDALITALGALGFRPKLRKDKRKNGPVSVSLRNCPYREAVRENQPAICALHKGITRGLIDALAPDAELTAFVPRDPDRADCRIEVSGLRTSSR